MSNYYTHLEALNAAISAEFADGVGKAWPGGYDGEIEAALIDAVFSIRARYGSSSDVGVRRVVGSWRSAQGSRALDDLRALAEQDPDQFAQIVDNRSRTGGRSKADVVLAAASALVEVDVVHARDLDDKVRRRAAKWAYIGTTGLSSVTWAYFSMLLGHPDLKADVHVVAWVTNAASGGQGALFSSEYVRDLLHACENPFPDLTALDHAIWSVQRSR